MSNSASGNITIGFILGLSFCLVITLVMKSYYHQECERDLIAKNKERSFVCVVKIQAVVVNKQITNRVNEYE